MTKSQKLQIEQSEKRQKINELLALDELTDEQRGELETLTKRMQHIEVEYRAAIVAEGEAEQRARADAPVDAELRERLELRSRARLSNYLLAAARGQLVGGAEAELSAAAGVQGIPLELWEPMPEQRAGQSEHRDVAVAPGTVGVNLDPIRPAVFANSIAARLGIDMPRVESGTYATATITTSQSAEAKAKSAAAAGVAGAFATATATPKRVSARLELTLEDIAAVGAANFESMLRQNLALALSDELDDQAINGNGTAPNLHGVFSRLTDPDPPGATVAGFDDFVAAFADHIDGLWASMTKEVGIVAGVDTYKLSAKTFRDRVIDETNKGAASLGDMAFTDYAMAHTGGWWTNKRMPAVASNVQQAILYRKGRSMMGGSMGMRTAVCPHWGEVSIDDVYSGSAKAERYFTMHVLLGDVILVQPDAYAQVAYRVSA